MAYVVQVFRFVCFLQLGPSLVGRTFINASGVKDAIVFAIFGVMAYFYTVVALGRGLFGTFSGRMSNLFAYVTFASEDARLGAFGFGVAMMH